MCFREKGWGDAATLPKVRLTLLGRDRQSPASVPVQSSQSWPPSPSVGGMDAIDSRIIDQLRRNARAGYGDIGGVVGLSASAVKRRVDRLVADGVIRGFTVQVDPAVEGLAVEAYVELFCRGTVAPEELRRILLAVPEVVEAGTVTGDADAIVRLRSRDIPSMEEALERVRSAPNVDHTRSAIVFSRLVDRSRA
jgi:DNA-binding Lrp family transcriptional regulator